MKCTLLPANWTEEPKLFNLMCVARLLIKISTVVALLCNFVPISFGVIYLFGNVLECGPPRLSPPN